MGNNTSISWTDFTFNPWHGCVEVSPGCVNCYAKTFSKRTGFSGPPDSEKPELWGKGAARRFFGEKHWNEPLLWNAAAARDGVRRRVFCGSMCDWLEDREDLIPHLCRLLLLIHETPFLDWLMLSKRPGNFVPRISSAYEKMRDSKGVAMTRNWLMAATGNSGYPAPENVWMGTTVENQEQADKRVPLLLGIPAHIRFLSVEPMLGPVDLYRVAGALCDRMQMNQDAPPEPEPVGAAGIDWVICGGESGGKRRPFDVAWAVDLANQCTVAGVPFHMKQDSAFKSGEQGAIPDDLWSVKNFPA